MYLNSKYLIAFITISLLAVLTLPTYIYFSLAPQFNELIITNTEREAQRVTSHLITMFHLEEEGLTNETIRDELTNYDEKLRKEFQLRKLKLYFPSGEIIYSSEPKDIGEINRRSYFTEIIAQGKIFSKAVNKNEKSLEGQEMPVDVVETYVPIMRGDKFIGAFEIYYDITESKQKLHRLLYRIYLTIFLISTAFFITIIFIAYKANKDIGTRKQAKDALQASQMRLKTLVETIPDLVWLKDTDGFYLACNRRFERFFGATEAEIIGKTDYDFKDKKLADFFREKDMEAIEVGEPSVNEEEVIYADDGHHEILETIKTPMYDRYGNLTGVLGIGRDITNRKETEAAIRKSEEQWERTFNSFTDIVTLQDTSLKIVKVNQKSCDILGLTFDDIIGKHCYELFHGSNEPCPECPLLVTKKTFEPYSKEMVHEKLGKTLLVSASAVLDDQGNLTHIAHVAKDITEQKLIEEKLFQAHKMEAIGNLAGGIAHDFNNILSAITGYSEIAKLNVPPDSSAAKDIAQVLKASKRATDLVQHILAFSRKSDHQLKPLAPHLIIKEALKMLRASLPTTIEIREDIDTKCGYIMADPTNIHQIIVNLCTNSLHAMESEKGTLSVSLYRIEISDDEIKGELGVSSGPFIVLEVRDTGHGMDQNAIRHIFDPYFTTKEVGKGTGLGLAVIHGITKDYHGFIKVESELGEGTTFRVHIPAIQQEEAYMDEAKIDEPLPTGTEQILIVDDESVIANLNKAVLEQLGYKVTATTSGIDALKKIRTDPDQFDLIITDQTMPHLTGAELAMEISKIKPDLPIILTTGYSSVLSEEDALTIGIKKYVRKPIERITLAKITRQILDENKDQLNTEG